MAEHRHIHLHDVALRQLRARPELRSRCLALVDRWLLAPEQVASRSWLAEWRAMLAAWPVDRIEAVVLDPDRGQVLRSCSPLAPLLTPRERWAPLAEAEALHRAAPR